MRPQMGLVRQVEARACSDWRMPRKSQKAQRMDRTMVKGAGPDVVMEVGDRADGDGEVSASAMLSGFLEEEL